MDKKKSQLKAKPLRLAGQSVQEQLEAALLELRSVDAALDNNKTED